MDGREVRRLRERIAYTKNNIRTLKRIIENASDATRKHVFEARLHAEVQHLSALFKTARTNGIDVETDEP